MGLFVDKEFESHSGKKLYFKIECDALTHDDYKTLAKLVAKHFKFKQVVGIATGGMGLALSLHKYCDPESERILIVDDVCHTGGSMEEKKKEIMESTGVDEDYVDGVVIFERADMSLYWVTPIFHMHHPFSDI